MVDRIFVLNVSLKYVLACTFTRNIISRMISVPKGRFAFLLIFRCFLSIFLGCVEKKIRKIEEHFRKNEQFDQLQVCAHHTGSRIRQLGGRKFLRSLRSRIIVKRYHFRTILAFHIFDINLASLTTQKLPPYESQSSSFPNSVFENSGCENQKKTTTSTFTC